MSFWLHFWRISSCRYEAMVDDIPFVRLLEAWDRVEVALTIANLSLDFRWSEDWIGKSAHWHAVEIDQKCQINFVLFSDNFQLTFVVRNSPESQIVTDSSTFSHRVTMHSDSCCRRCRGVEDLNRCRPDPLTPKDRCRSN